MKQEGSRQPGSGVPERRTLAMSWERQLLEEASLQLALDNGGQPDPTVLEAASSRALETTVYGLALLLYQRLYAVPTDGLPWFQEEKLLRGLRRLPGLPTRVAETLDDRAEQATRFGDEAGRAEAADNEAAHAAEASYDEVGRFGAAMTMTGRAEHDFAAPDNEAGQASARRTEALAQCAADLLLFLRKEPEPRLFMRLRSAGAGDGLDSRDEASRETRAPKRSVHVRRLSLRSASSLFYARTAPGGKSAARRGAALFGKAGDCYARPWRNAGRARAAGGRNRLRTAPLPDVF